MNSKRAQTIFMKIKEGMEEGDPLFKPSTRLPSVRELSKRYNEDLNVISKAVFLLMEENLVHSKPGVGLFCGPKKTERYRFIQDNDSHWYSIKVSDTHFFHKWVDAMEDADFETLDELPDFENNRCLYPTNYSFDRDPTEFTIDKSDWEPEEYK